MSAIAGDAPAVPPPVQPAPVRPRFSERLDAMPSWMGAAIGAAVLVVIWWVASLLFFQLSHAIPTPPSVIRFFFDGSSWSRLWTSLQNTIASAAEGYLWGNLAAILFAIIVMLIPPLAELVNQIAIVSYCIPTVAVAPLIILISPTRSDAASVALAVLGVFFTTVVGALLGLRAAPRTALDVVHAYGGNKWTALRKVQIVSALPSLLSALKLAAPGAFLGAVLAEYLGSGEDNSLGKALLNAQFASDAPQLWYLALVSAGVAGLAFFLVGLVGKLVTPWAAGVEGGEH